MKARAFYVSLVIYRRQAWLPERSLHQRPVYHWSFPESPRWWQGYRQA